MTPPQGSGLLRGLAALLIRGDEAAFILVDLDDALEHDLARGLPSWRARWRYAVNMLASAGSVWGARLRPSALGFSWIDVKVGVRMLKRHPGLTAVAVFALAIGIPVGLAPIHFVNAIEAPLPVDEGDRIRTLRHWDAETLRSARPTSYDFARWREGLTTFETLGAMQVDLYYLASENGVSAPVPGAEVTASTFDILRVRPLLGRVLVAADEVIGAPPVAVVGYDFWQSRLAGNPDIVGEDIRLGDVPHTVVGVMPEEFLFPFRHQLWLPLRLEPVGEPVQEPGLRVFGRLAAGASPETAQTELTAVGLGQALAFPDTYERLEPEVVPFAFTIFNFSRGGMWVMPEFYLTQTLAMVLLVVACANVGLLIFARTAARTSELAVRTALGASRARVVSQMFVESLVLAVVAAGVGVLFFTWLPSYLMPADLAQVLPYWIDFGVTPGTALRALSLAAFSAVVAGVVPALKVTGKGVQRNIQSADAGRSGIRVGRVSSALIVIDVAIAVAVVGLAAGLSDRVMATWAGRDAVGIQADQFLSVQLSLPGSETLTTATAADRMAFMARVGATQQALVERLEAEPGIRGVAVASVLPRMDHPQRWAEVAGEDQPDDPRGSPIRTARIDPNFFNALDQPILAGRGFDAGDLGEDSSTVIVNTTFVETVLDGRNPVGKRVRYRAWNTEVGPWYEIVGVVGQLGMHVLNPEGDAGLYHPMAPGAIHPVRLAIHVGDDPESFTPRLRTLVSEVDPLAGVATPMALDKAFEGDWYIMAAVTGGLVLLVGILLALAASGLYAIMSFTVAERTREIGIRIALGADRGNIALTVARRSLVQIGVGVLLGLPLAGRIFFEILDDRGSDYAALSGSVGALALGIGMMALIGLLACTAPTLRALRVMPTEALKGDG